MIEILLWLPIAVLTVGTAVSVVFVYRWNTRRRDQSKIEDINHEYRKMIERIEASHAHKIRKARSYE